jgi:hypothetical protein
MREYSVGATPTAGATSTLYTVPTGYRAIWNLSYLHNTSGSTKTCTLSWFDSSASATYDILSSYTFTSKDYLKFDGGAYVVLEEGDQVKVTPESGSTFTVILTFVLKGNQRE